MNIVIIVIDSLRKDHVGAYGNKWIVTPHLDKFASESVLFTSAYPESLPTLPFRRALHTGIRTYPFYGHKDYKGDFSGAPGWGPIPEDQDTMAELLKEHGYRSSFITDCYHQFKPSKNFHRGFDQWIWIRGQEHDRYRSGTNVSTDRIEQHMKTTAANDQRLADFLRKYLRNNAYRMTEQDYYPARLFKEASRWIWENQDAENFFLLVDSFDPHEPWDPPIYYRKLYDPDDDCADIIQSVYSKWKGKLTEREVKRVQANYAGEVTLVDRWFGVFIETLKSTGRLSDTIVALISDHGHNLGLEPGDKGLISKQGHPMTHAVADLVLMIRHPNRKTAGITCDKLVYNHDLTITLLSQIGIKPMEKTGGIDFWPAVMHEEKKTRDYVTIAWGPLVTVINNRWWYNANIWGKGQLLYDLNSDQYLEKDLSKTFPEVCKKMLDLAIHDAGDSIPDYFVEFESKPGCTPYWSQSVM